jgi:hypothetical protein
MDIHVLNTNFGVFTWKAFPTLQQTSLLTISNFLKPCARATNFDMFYLLDMPLLYENVHFGKNPQKIYMGIFKPSNVVGMW